MIPTVSVRPVGVMTDAGDHQDKSVMPPPHKVLLYLKGEDIAYTGKVALTNITLFISEGEKVALIGQSGAGKTTLLRRLFQLEPDQCSFIHQHQALVDRLSTFHNIYMGRLDRYSLLKNLRNLLVPEQTQVEQIRLITRRLHLEDKLFTRIGELSGGQQQRVAVGRAMYRGGEVLMADEPVSSLDAIQGAEVMKYIVSSGKTVVASLHSVDLAKEHFQRIIGLKDRKIFFDLPTHMVTSSHLEQLYG